MALKKLPFKRLQHLIGLHLSTKELAPTQRVIDELAISKKRGYLTKPELIEVCRWKSARAINHIKRNRADTIQRVTKAAFRTRSERKKLSFLTSLHGVSVPMASSILMLTNPARYGVIDIRVWELLYEMGAVTTNADGMGFDFEQWYRYLKILRQFARKYKVGARDIERTLFSVHTLYQQGTLYKH
ncbi:MAG: hypothetical protein WB699_00345 [Bacteroidota bacterium]